ncbi:MAG: CoA transferase [Methylobacteriaceae bacterium]|nr:CoA transferase [Methylobacteriaceae bacterium]
MGFAGLRVLETGSLASASWCARLFADFGADVLKLEPDGGDPLRQASPLFDGPSGHESAAFAFLNFGKRLARRRDADLSALLSDCDVLILGDDDAPEIAACARETLIVVDASWFGRSGPYRDHPATDATVRALAGLVQLVGPRDGPPMAAPDFQAGYVAGLWAFIAACAGLMARARDGGRRFDASVFEACVTLTEYQVAEAAIRNEPQQRSGIGRFAPTYPLGVYRASDGWIGATMVTPAQWGGFCEMLGLPELAVPHFTTGLERLPHADELEAQFAPRLAEKPAAHWFAEGLKRRLPIVVVPKIEALASTPEFRARGAIVDIHAGGRTLSAPASPLRLAATPPAVEATLANAGSSAPTWIARDAAPKFDTPQAPKGALPLSGFRIVDFTMGWAGPLCARTLADLGADVIKIEGCSYPDWWRGVDRRPNVLREKLYEKTGRYAVMNRNKRGIAIDLTRPEGLRLAWALVAKADAVVENYSVEVLPKLGLAPAGLRAENPKLVTLSMSAFGASSPWRDCRAYGSTLEQASGLPQLLGRPGDPPVMGHPAYGDPVGGLAGMAALMAALLNARRTGEGQHIDLSQVECMMQMVGPWALAHSADGTMAQRSAGRHPDHAPSGVYPCAGEDAWISIAATSDAAWPRLAALIGRPDLAALLERAARQAAAREIDTALSAWTRARTPDVAMGELHAAGIAAGVVRRPLDLLTDPHLVARDFWIWTERAHIGRHAQPAAAVRDAAAPYPVRWPSPTLGQYNRTVLGELLGLSETDIDGLERAGVIGDQLVVAGDAERGAA